MARGSSQFRQNAQRSALVVLGSIAFGYLTLKVGFKPYLERARQASEVFDKNLLSESDSQTQQDSSGFSQEGNGKYKDTVLE